MAFGLCVECISKHLSYILVLVGLLLGLLIFSMIYAKLLPSAISEAWRFCWTCFLKPHTGDAARSQQHALESFYKTQASIYDATRTRLLWGREDMLGLVAAQMQQRMKSGTISQKPVWIDVGGGTGYNIEQMARFVNVPTFFGAVYLVDLSPSLCAVAQDRFVRLGWKNVHVICQDARSFALSSSSTKGKTAPHVETYPQQAQLITMSYSLSMIPEHYSVLDALSDRLSDNGIIGVADFYVQSEVDYRCRDYLGGEINRHCMWISRVFWRAWFEADRIGLEAARRDYLEYRFGTVLSFNGRCRLVGFRIPFYVWIGCSKHSIASQSNLARLNAAVTNSPFISALDQQQRKDTTIDENTVNIRSKAYESAVVKLASRLPLPSTWYQQHQWRIYYDYSLDKHRQFNDEYIYSFTWEDSRVDSRILKLSEDDVVLAITSAGDNILAYALDRPKRIHAVDLNPAQNHLLELKLAAFTALPYEDVWRLFGEGKHPDFRGLLITKLSPHMSSLAFQYWLEHGPPTFSPSGNGLFFTGGSRHALLLLSYVVWLLNLKDEVARLCEAQTLVEQQEIWRRSLRRVLLSRLLNWSIVSSKKWLWKALGVPSAQCAMIEKDSNANEYAASSAGSPSSSSLDNGAPHVAAGQGRSHDASTPRHTHSSGEAVWSYAVNTLDPVISSTLLSSQNHYYLLTLLGRYTRQCHPDYLTRQAHEKLRRANAFGGLRIHTDEIVEVIERMEPGSLTVAVVMDSMDWFDEGNAVARSELTRQVQLLRRALKTGGRVLLRSAGTMPWYLREFEKERFTPKRVNVRTPGACVDRVNMYASTWLCYKCPDPSNAGEMRLPHFSIGKGAITDGSPDADRDHIHA